MDDSFTDSDGPYCPNTYIKMMKSALKKDETEEKQPATKGIEKVPQAKAVEEDVILSDDSHEEARYVTRARKKLTKVTRAAKLKNKPKKPIIDIVSSDEDSDTEQEIKVVWNHRLDNLHVYHLKKHQSLSVIVDELSRLYSTPVGLVSLVLNKKRVSPQDTVESLKINVTSILEAGIFSDTFNHEETSKKIEIKCISSDVKKPIIFHVFPTQPLKVFYDYLKLQELPNGTKLAIKKLKLIFDGDEVKPEDTAEELGLEGGECFDLYVS
jgi:hypothetical protein